MVRTIVVDIDGILTLETEGYGPNYYPYRTPNIRNIETLRDYKRRGFKIILYSSRHKEDESLTKQWLRKYCVPYDALILGKPLAHTYIDDRATNILDKEVLCLSGGLDSTIAWHYLQYPEAVYVKLNHRYQQKELTTIQNLKKYIESHSSLKLLLHIVDGPDLSLFEYGETAYIPRRNLLLALIASYYGNKIYIVGIKGDKVEDKSPEAFKTMSYAINFISKPTDIPVKIDSPFWNMTKTQIVKWFLDTFNEKYALGILKTSVSCYSQSTLGQCGRCPSCFRKWIALEAAGIKCYDWFENDIRKWEGIKRYRKRAEEGYYDPARCKDILEVLDKYGL